MEKLLNNLEEGGWELSHIYLRMPTDSSQEEGHHPSRHKWQGGRWPVHHRINTRQKYAFNLPDHLIGVSLDCGGGGGTRASNRKTFTKKWLADGSGYSCFNCHGNGTNHLATVQPLTGKMNGRENVLHYIYGMLTWNYQVKFSEINQWCWQVTSLYQQKQLKVKVDGRKTINKE